MTSDEFIKLISTNPIILDFRWGHEPTLLNSIYWYYRDHFNKDNAKALTIRYFTKLYKELS